MLSNFSHTRPILGLISIFLGILVYSLINLLIKDLSVDFSIAQLLLFRTSVAMIPALGMLLYFEKSPRFATPDLIKLIWLGFINMLSIWFIFKSFALLKISQAQTLCFTSIIFVTLMSPVFLHEKLTVLRVAAVIGGFLGVVMVAQPSGESINPWGVLTAMLFAFCDAIVLMGLRHIGARNSSYKSAFYLMFFASLWCLAFYGASRFLSDNTNHVLSIQWNSPDVRQLQMLLLLGIGGGFGQILVANAFRLADATLVSPVIYMGVVWGLVFDWLFFQNAPTVALILGALFVIGSGLLIVFEEKFRPLKRS